MMAFPHIKSASSSAKIKRLAGALPSFFFFPSSLTYTSLYASHKSKKRVIWRRVIQATCKHVEPLWSNGGSLKKLGGTGDRRDPRWPVGRINSSRHIVTIWCCSVAEQREGEEERGWERNGGSRRLIHGVNSKGSVNYICFAAQLCPCRSPQKTSQGWCYQFQTIGTVPESSFFFFAANAVIRLITSLWRYNGYRHGHMWHIHAFLLDSLLDDQLPSVFARVFSNKYNACAVCFSK